MKTIIFFDVDNTIYNNTLGLIPIQTKRLLQELSKKDDIILGLATGRGISKLEIIKDVLPFFTYKVLINGSIVYHHDDIIYDHPIDIHDIAEVLEITKGNHFNVGMVGVNDEAVNYLDERVELGMQELRATTPKVDPDFYLHNKIYQLWIFADSEDRIVDVAKKINKFVVYPWHKGGADFIYPIINKSFGIKKALEHETDFRLICIGDGANDIQMVEMADIGIAMDNTRFTELKEKADHVAPHIKEDQLYDFFKHLGLI